MHVSLLMLADGRFPAGGHAHSAGMEEAILAGLVRDAGDVVSWAGGVLRTSGLTSAGLAAASCVMAQSTGVPAPHDWDLLDAEADARTPAPAQRAVSRQLGRQLLRTVRELWASDALHLLGERWPAGAHRSIVFGAAVAASGGSPLAAATGEAYGAVSVPVAAAVRLLSLDPVAGARVLAGLASAIEEVAAQAADASAGLLGHLPSRSAPVLDLCFETHALRKESLFAS